MAKFFLVWSKDLIKSSWYAQWRMKIYWNSTTVNALITPNLKWKKLSNNSSWDFEHVLDTMDDYWVGPDENFCPESTPTRWRCYHFSKKWSKSKFDATLSIKKPFVTPKFCGRNFSQMHHFEDMNFLSPLDSSYLLKRWR